MNIYTTHSSYIQGLTLDIVKTGINKTPSHIMQIGGAGSRIMFVLTSEELADVAEQWIYELSAAYRSLSYGELDAHDADGTLIDLFHGSDSGGKQ